jgi:hypothetical protein
MTRFVSLALAASLALLGSAASAVDLTGTYEGKLICRGLSAEGQAEGVGQATKTSNKNSVLEISQELGAIRAELDGQLFEGAALNELGKEDKEAAAVAVACHNDGDPAATVASLQLEVKVAPGSGKSTLKLTQTRGNGLAVVCTGSYKRTVTTNPELGACPVFYSCVCSGTGGGAGACGNGGIGGDPGNVHQDIDQGTLDSGYVNGNDTGWVCVAQ